ncbi:MAG: tetratricopeptide repeat protein [candidate division NC10 bacterium]|nr:tetratricopeptide repeat protein [candidate division NC10 bacterium]
MKTRNTRGRVTLLVCASLAALLAGCSATQDLSAKFRRSMQAQRAHNDGLELYKAEKYAEALPHFRRALTLYPDFDEAMSYLAWSLYHTGQYAEAARHFGQALKREPRWEGLHDGLGWSRYRQGKYAAAIDAFQAALAIDDRYRDADVGIAYSLFEAKRYAEALPRLERLTREGEGQRFFLPRAKDVEDVRSRLAWTLYYLGEYERAGVEFRQGIAARPDWYGLHAGLGWTHLKLKNNSAARQSFERALSLKPGYPDAKEGLARLR